jgi:hypothetical protein
MGKEHDVKGRGPRRGQKGGAYHLVLNRSCADLYEEIAEAFADRRYIKVVMDRRQGPEGMAEIPAGAPRRPRRQGGQTNPRLLSVRIRNQVS